MEHIPVQKQADAQQAVPVQGQQAGRPAGLAAGLSPALLEDAAGDQILYNPPNRHDIHAGMLGHLSP